MVTQPRLQHVLKPDSKLNLAASVVVFHDHDTYTLHNLLMYALSSFDAHFSPFIIISMMILHGYLHRMHEIYMHGV